MIILALEASAKTASAAVLADGMVKAEACVNGTLTHSETLMPMIENVMKMAGLEPEAVDVIALTNGPGSFTGLRIGAATAKGIAFGIKKPLMPVSTLEVLGYGCIASGAVVVPVMDARRHQVYTAVYQDRRTLKAPEAMSPKDLAQWLKDNTKEQRILLTGDAAVLYEAELREALGERLELAPAFERYQNAAVLGVLAYEKLEQGTEPIRPDQLTIDYLRKPQAEREREARLKQQHEG